MSSGSEFNPSIQSDDLSLIKYVSQQDHTNTIDEILFGKCKIDDKYTNIKKEEFATNIRRKSETIEEVFC